MNKILPYYSLLSIVFLIGCLQAFFVGIPKTLQHHPIVDQLLEKPEDSALLLIKNGETVINRNIDTQLPLASLSKIVIGLVFAEQAVKHLVEPEQKIPLSSLKRFYVDDENYQTWKAIGLEEGWITKEEVALKYVAQGAIRFSANTNADFLMEHLGLASINEWLQEKGLMTHEAIFPFGASAVFCHNLEKMPKKTFLAQMDTMSRTVYIQKVLSIHEKLASGTISLEFPKINDQTFLKVWSDHFTKATAKDYAKITELLLNKKALDKELQQMIKFLFEEWAFAENPGLDQQFSSIGFKGGSTGFLLNTILYLEDQNGNQAQVVLLMNELSSKKHELISKLFSGFVFDLATNDDFVKSVQQVLAAND
ncbi:MAG: serine hydrolase [Saprospiraceae bacterium]|nr:serine hydrolase [Saprospiraceae bacterium]